MVGSAGWNRRRFLAALGAAAGGLALPYEPKRIYSFPSLNDGYWHIYVGPPRSPIGIDEFDFRAQIRKEFDKLLLSEWYINPPPHTQSPILR